MEKAEIVTKSPKFSIVVPVLNNEKFIEETLKSILKQTYSNFEVIIQDGKSTDNTLQIIREYQKKHSKIIKVYSEKDSGQFDAINKGFKKSTGDILAFLNSDDLYNKNALQLIKEAYLENPDALWFAGYGAVINEDGSEIAKAITRYKNLLLRSNKYSLLLAVNYLMQPSVFITKKAYKKYGPMLGTKSFLREYDLWLKIGRDKMPVVIPETISYFRLSKNMISASKFKQIAEDDLNTAKHYTKSSLLILIRSLHNKARALFLP